MASPDDAGPEIFEATGRLRLGRFSESATAALQESLRQAHQTSWESLRSPHIFMGLLAAPDAAVLDWAHRLGEDLSSILTQFQELFHQHGVTADAVLQLNREFLSDNAIKLLREACQRAAYHRRARVTQMDLLIALLTSKDNIVVECFESIGQNAAKLTELAVLAEHNVSPH